MSAPETQTFTITIMPRPGSPAEYPDVLCAGQLVLLNAETLGDKVTETSMSPECGIMEIEASSDARSATALTEFLSYIASLNSTVVYGA